MNTILNFKTDKALKEEAKKVARELGLPLGTIMNHYLKELVREKQVLFTNHPTPSQKVVTELQVLSQDVANRKNLSPAFRDATAATKWLDS